MRVGAVEVHGRMLDAFTRCVHYATDLDIVAIQFACCGRWYPCLHCHAEAERHPIVRWAAAARSTRAILCGNCGGRLGIDTYCSVDRCPACQAAFNPRCSLHFPIYFEPPITRAGTQGRDLYWEAGPSADSP